MMNDPKLMIIEGDQEIYSEVANRLNSSGIHIPYSEDPYLRKVISTSDDVKKKPAHDYYLISKAKRKRERKMLNNIKNNL